MIRKLVALGGLSIVCGALLLPSTLQAQSPNAANISFTVSMPKPWTHLLEVEMQIGVPANLNVPNETNLIMPVWTPGSYLIREYERHVQDFAPVDANGNALQWSKVDKNTWRVVTRGARRWKVNYRVYANELTVRTNELNSDHAFWNNAALLMYPEGSLGRPSTLRVLPANNWKVATGLPPLTGQTNTFRAENFDILYDSPVEVSNFKQIDFDVRGVPHRIVIDGEGNYDPERMRATVKKIVETETSMFGGSPYHDYTFILHLRSSAGGGLEHLNSTSLGFPRFRFTNDLGYRRFAELVAHEFFHVWNVKRIRPDALGPFDYTKENYTSLLWVAEGITEYYANLVVRRVGIMSDQEYLEHLAKAIQDFQSTPGRLEMSAEEASFNAWIKEYRPDENSVNSQISYYDKGELLGMLLDLEIRRRTNNAKSLDDVMRTLYAEFFGKGRNYSPADFQKICESVSGGSFEDFFARYVRGHDEVPYNQFLSAAGLRLEETPADEKNPAPVKGFLGADLDDRTDIILIESVRAGSPAYEQGLNAKDQIIALNGARVSKAAFESMIEAKKPGEIVHLTLFRNDDLRTFDIKLGSRVDAAYRLVQLPSGSEQQKRIYQTWLPGR
jgi:predicted metalloprotease with PDZ domain